MADEMTTPTDEQIAQMRAEVAAYDAAQAAQAAAATAEKMKPIQDLAASDAFKSVVASVTSLANSGTYYSVGSLGIHLQAAAQTLSNLASAIPASAPSPVIAS